MKHTVRRVCDKSSFDIAQEISNQDKISRHHTHPIPQNKVFNQIIMLEEI
jgi:hypothetical protein